MSSEHGSGLPQRRSLRLKSYDYSQPGACFVTLCTQGKESRFAEVRDDGYLELTEFGHVVRESWNSLPQHFAHVAIDQFIVMPNHVHGILVLGDDVDAGTACRAPTLEGFSRPTCGSIPTVVRSFKAAVTRQINSLRGMPGAVVWQRGYYEHVIRGEEELKRIREYIINNPRRWDKDEYNLNCGRGTACRARLGRW